jgi:hypothetical protein
MKKNLFLLAILLVLGGILLAVSTVDPGDPEKVLARARHYRLSGQYEKALKDHLWFHDHALKHKPALYGVRLSFALQEWIALGEKYPKARQALIEIRDRKTQLMKKGNGSPELFHDVQSMNRFLYESQKTVDLIKDMTVSDFEMAKRCYDLAKTDLIAAEEFELCNQLMDVPMFIVRDMKALLNQNITIYKTTAWADEPHLEWTIRHFLEEAESVLIVLTKNQRFVEAERFLKEAGKEMDIARIQSGLADLRSRYLIHR